MEVLITGASGAIGGALAEELARPGQRLHLHGRNASALRSVAERCQRRGASAEIAAFDLRDRGRLAEWLQQLPLLDLAVINAGFNCFVESHWRLEDEGEVEQLLEVNLRAALVIARAVVADMVVARRGQLALMSSLAGLYPIAVMPTYSASKAAIRAYGLALAEHLRGSGVSVSVIEAGFVRSAMCDAMPGPKPFLLSPQAAAVLIRRGLERQRLIIRFPFWLGVGMRLLSCMPPTWANLLVGWSGYVRR